MNINTNVYKQYVKSGGSRIPRSYFCNTAEKIPAAKKDTFSLSSEASMFSECGKIIKSAVAEISSPASEDRINLLRQQIKNGSYGVSADKVADAILNRIV